MNCIELILPPLPQFITIGHDIWKPGNVHNSRTFHIYDLLLVVKGTLYMTERDQAYSVGPGQFLVLEPGMAHFGHKACEEDTEIYWVHFTHPGVSRTRPLKELEWNRILQQGTDVDPAPREHSMFIPKYMNCDVSELIPVLQSMLQIQSLLNVGNAIQLHVYLMEFLSRLQKGLQRSLKITPSMKLSNRIKEYLAGHYTVPFQVQTMEQAFHFHIDYLTRCLKKHTGLTPLQYLHYLRMEEAKLLLVHSELKISAIAMEIGMENDNYFIRLFKKHTGFTPGEYRKRRQGSV
ncbi:hypothetical protein SY83_13555 [Paenibacillus swuensis]|uniref:HTH araC/xylS-type domain-containing protein n=1 Tax=Paenibacillus swuensis TaxID=1178515 RepID=A0A172TJV4_9BACL|nr:AraC family transcriptional regulator [Paenibacillus swuensis]ANE47117.1 hypothetical protein SY83_13555 [Paenibacillus swuensis]